MMVFAKILCISLVCLGLRTVTDRGMLLFPLRQRLIALNKPSVTKPLLLCVTCMASFWGVMVNVGFWLTYGHWLWFDLFVSTIGAAYVNTVGWVVLNNLKA